MAASDKTYFVGRSELLGWINTTLGTTITKVEETASGAVACQIMDALHPGVVPMKKVDYNAKNEYEYISNYKVLQDVFNKLQIDKPIDMAKLVKGRPLDNTEFMQWLKSYHDTHTGGRGVPDYDGPGRRAVCKTGDVRGAAAASARTAAPGSIRRSDAAASTPNGAAAPPSSSSAASSALNTGGTVGALRSGHSSSNIHTAAPAVKRAAAGKLQAGGAAVEQLQLEVGEWRAKAEAANKEKEFYYSKLRAIELLCNVPVVAQLSVTKVVEEILYAATSEEGEAVLEAAQRQFAADEEAAAAEAAAAEATAAAAETAATADGAGRAASSGEANGAADAGAEAGVAGEKSAGHVQGDGLGAIDADAAGLANGSVAAQAVEAV